MNPYAFVPVGSPAPRTPLSTHERFAGHSGVLKCRLTTLTHFFIAGKQERQARNQHQELHLLREGNQPIIPGSSLKGAIRHLAEAISGSCLALPSDVRMRDPQRDKLEYYDFKKRSSDSYAVPPGFSPCGLRENADPRTQRACPCCRLFGYLAGSVLLTGNVSFETAHLVSAARIERVTLEPFGAPSPRHRPFYGTAASNFQTFRGRKFYYHRVEGARAMAQKSDFNKTIEAVFPGAVYEFSVSYQNLDEAELALLIYALTLEEPMHHKLGMGRGVGLGSVHLEITGWQQMERKQRYLDFGAGTTVLAGEELQHALARQIEAYHRHYAPWQSSLAVLKDILTWDEKQPRNPGYPSNKWFKENPSVALEDVSENAADYGAALGEKRPPFRPGAPPRTFQPEPRATSERSATILRQFERETAAQAATGQQVYKNGEVEKKATVVRDDHGKLFVTLPKLSDQHVPLKVKSTYSAAQPGKKIRVKLAVDRHNNVTTAEEL